MIGVVSSSGSTSIILMVFRRPSFLLTTCILKSSLNYLSPRFCLIKLYWHQNFHWIQVLYQNKMLKSFTNVFGQQNWQHKLARLNHPFFPLTKTLFCIYLGFMCRISCTVLLSTSVLTHSLRSCINNEPSFKFLMLLYYLTLISHTDPLFLIIN